MRLRGAWQSLVASESVLAVGRGGLAPGVPIESGLGRVCGSEGHGRACGYEISVGDLEWALWIMPI